MTVKRRDHILVKHRADVIRDSVSVSAVQYVFVWMVTHCLHSRQTQLYIADTTTEKLLVSSFYLNKCPHLQYLSSVSGRPSTLHLVMLFMTSNVCSTSNAPLSMQHRQFTTSKNFKFAVQLFFFSYLLKSATPSYVRRILLERYQGSFFLYRLRHRLIKHLGGEGPNKFLSGARPLQALTPLYLTLTEPT